MTDLLGASLPQDLTKTELAILRRLAAEPDIKIPRADLLRVLKGKAPHTIDSHIMAIRRKLRKAGASIRIETIVGFGFILRS